MEQRVRPASAHARAEAGKPAPYITHGLDGPSQVRISCFCWTGRGLSEALRLASLYMLWESDTAVSSCIHVELVILSCSYCAAAETAPCSVQQHASPGPRPLSAGPVPPYCVTSGAHATPASLSSTGRRVPLRETQSLGAVPSARPPAAGLMPKKTYPWSWDHP